MSTGLHQRAPLEGSSCCTGHEALALNRCNGNGTNTHLTSRACGTALSAHIERQGHSELIHSTRRIPLHPSVSRERKLARIGNAHSFPRCKYCWNTAGTWLADHKCRSVGCRRVGSVARAVSGSFQPEVAMFPHPLIISHAKTLILRLGI